MLVTSPGGVWWAPGSALLFLTWSGNSGSEITAPRIAGNMTEIFISGVFKSQPAVSQGGKHDKTAQSLRLVSRMALWGCQWSLFLPLGICCQCLNAQILSRNSLCSSKLSAHVNPRRPHTLTNPVYLASIAGDWTPPSANTQPRPFPQE